MTNVVYTLRPNAPDREALQYRGPTFECKRNEGLEAIATGTACFAEVPQEPPFELLEILESQLSKATPKDFGHRLDDARLSRRIHSELFPGSVRQSHIRGHPIRWVEGVIGLRWCIGDVLSEPSVEPCNLFAEARWLAAGHGIATDGIDDNPTIVHSRMIWLSDLDLIRPRYHAPHNTYSERWNSFANRLMVLQKPFQRLVGAAISECHVIISKESEAGSAFVVPGAFKGLEIPVTSREHLFALARDIPQSWLGETVPLQSRRREAVAWLMRAEKNFHPRRFSRDTARQVVMEKFYLSDNAAGDVVKAYRSGGKRKSGRIPQSESVSLEDLLAFA